MLQRIQTLYILIVAIFIASFYMWFPLVVDAAEKPIVSRDEPLVLACIIGIFILALVSIFKFKKRQLQFVLNRLNIILNFFLLGVFVVRSLNVSGEVLASVKGIGIFLPLLSIVFLVLANRAIKRDEDLVKSVDRLR